MSKGHVYELAVVSFVYNRDGANREFRDGDADQEDIVLSLEWHVNSTTLLDEDSRFYRILGVMTVPPAVPPTPGRACVGDNMTYFHHANLSNLNLVLTLGLTT